MCKVLEFLIQILNVGGIKFGKAELISPTAKFSSMPIYPATHMIYSSYKFAY